MSMVPQNLDQDTGASISGPDETTTRRPPPVTQRRQNGAPITPMSSHLRTLRLRLLGSSLDTSQEGMGEVHIDEA